MKRAITLICVVAVLMMAAAAFRLSKARAAAPAPPTPVSNPTDVHLFCHEAGTPLADYVNLMDVSPADAFTALSGSTGVELNHLRHNGGGAPTVVTQPIYFETSTTPSNCADADNILKDDGLTLQQAFSHFGGYYVEIWSKSSDASPR